MVGWLMMLEFWELTFFICSKKGKFLRPQLRSLQMVLLKDMVFLKDEFQKKYVVIL